jgi:hypothetical protein
VARLRSACPYAMAFSIQVRRACPLASRRQTRCDVARACRSGAQVNDQTGGVRRQMPPAGLIPSVSRPGPGFER